MQIGIRPHLGMALAILTSRIDGANPPPAGDNNALLNQVDFSNPIEVAAARTAILHMDVWNDVVEEAFQRERETEAREAIADTVLRLQAAVWESDFYGEIPAEGLEPEDLLAAQVKFFSLLTPQGLRAMTAKYEVAAEGIRYTPDTGNVDADHLLRMVVSEDVINGLRRLGPAAKDVADTLAEHVQAWRSAEASRQEAQYWEGVGWTAELEENYHDGAIAMEKAAAAWAIADQSRVFAAQAWCGAAAHLRQVGQFHRAAELEETAARIYEEAGLPGEGSKAFANAAWSWRQAGEHTRAASSHEMGAAACEAAGHHERAAEQWKAAGALGQAANAWRRALNDVGPETAAGAEVAARASLLFDFDMDFEDTLNG